MAWKRISSGLQEVVLTIAKPVSSLCGSSKRREKDEEGVEGMFCWVARNPATRMMITGTHK